MLKRKPVAALLAAVLVLLGACSSGDKKPSTESAFTETESTEPSTGLPVFYSVPDPLPPGQPGDVIKTATILSNSLGRMFRVMYHSRSLDGKDIPVTGIVAVPNGTPPDGGYPVVSWDHSTTGLADKCAPSLSINNVAAVAAGVVTSGHVLVATDYEGMGTPGRHPYLVGESEARGTIDIVRAARNMTEAHASDRYVVWGHSQGGHAAIYAADIAPTWAPELHLLGVVAGAPPSDLRFIDQTLNGGALKSVLLMMAAGFNAAYGDTAAPLDANLTPDGQASIRTLDNLCNRDYAAATAKVDMAKLETNDPLASPEWSKVLNENDPLQLTAAMSAPMLILQGGEDEVVPVETTGRLYDHLCGLGQVTQRWVYPGQSHAGVLGVAGTDTLKWIEERFDDKDIKKSVRPSGTDDVAIQHCP